MSIRECDRCHALKPNGQRCRLQTCTTGRYCWIHTQSLYHLRVNPSTIPGAGKGLFTTQPIHTGQSIVRYTGDVLNRHQLDERYLDGVAGDYVLQVNQNRFIDARSTQSSVARYVNSTRGTNRPSNTSIGKLGHPFPRSIHVDSVIHCYHHIPRIFTKVVESARNAHSLIPRRIRADFAFRYNLFRADYRIRCNGLRAELHILL